VLSESLAVIIGFLLYPGLLAALVWGSLYALVVDGALPQRPFSRAALSNHEGLASLFSIILAGTAPALLRWPWGPLAIDFGWIWLWMTMEAAFLVPLIPSLLAGTSPVVRAAIRRLQAGVMARMGLWAALAVAAGSYNNWSPAALPAHILAILAGAIAYPIAVGWGPFATETTITPQGARAGLDPATRGLYVFAHQVRSGTLLAATWSTMLPISLIPTPLGLLLIVGGFAGTVLLMRNLRGRLPRMTLPHTLHICRFWLTPICVAAIAALAFV
jgi:hypothetical protein